MTLNQMRFIRPVPVVLFSLFVLLACLCAPCAAAEKRTPSTASAAKAQPTPAADTDSGKQAATRAAIKAGATPVAVDLDGTDTLGAKLSFQLKEILNAGTLFNLTDNEMPKIRVILSTVSEFPSRPEVGSAYAAVWLYYERPTAFNSYLASEVGTVTAESVADLAARLAERTAGFAAKYSYIFNR